MKIIASVIDFSLVATKDLVHERCIRLIERGGGTRSAATGTTVLGSEAYSTVSSPSIISAAFGSAITIGAPTRLLWVRLLLMGVAAA